MRKHNAFTMAEVLVTIGIIAVLICLLVPAVSTAVDSARTVKCLSNLRQIGMAITTYANDHNGCLVPGDYIGYIDGYNMPGGGNWADILVDEQYVSAPAADYSTASTTADFEAGDLRESIFRCPAGEDQNAVDDYPTTQVDGRGRFYFSRGSDTMHKAVFTWYAINCMPRLNSDLSAQARRPLPFTFLPDFATNQPNWTINRLSQMDNSPALIFDGVWCFNDDPARINARHGRRRYTNVLYADGHCQSELSNTLPNESWYLN